MINPDEGFYCPNSIGSLRSFFWNSIPDDGTLQHRNGFVNNIGYNLQYLEFLNHLITETRLHCTVIALTQKTFVVVGMGIVEALLWYTLRKNKLVAVEEWGVVHELKTNDFKDGTSNSKRHGQSRLI